MVSVRRALSWWGRDYAYAAYWQVRGTLRPGDRDELAGGGGRPVVMLPGVWETWGFLRPLIDPLHTAGHPVHVVPALQRNSRPVPDAAAVVARMLDDLDLRDTVIVAHSKGGLIGKYVMAELDPDARVRAMVAICTPFAGSDYARYMASRTLRAFSPDDPTTLQLQEQLEVNSRITTITGVFDPHIPQVARLDGARNLTLDDGGHFRVMENPEVVRTVLEVASGAWPASHLEG
jgi:pimeloyl-ACP methyl ester carboxylesterase